MTQTTNFTLDFERPIHDLENQIRDLKQAAGPQGIDLSAEIQALQTKVNELLKDIYANLRPWERVQLSRHPQRPHTQDYIEAIIDDFHALHGDRKFADDPAVIAGFGFLAGQKVAVVGIEKGRKTKEKIVHNFGMPRPEGYRKAIRIMELANQFEIPIVSFVDTPGAYPGIGAEERGQAAAIAENLEKMMELNSPTISVVIGEGGSGGALGIAVADRVYMMEHAVYSVISPESCASILWADPKKAAQAADALQLSSMKAKELEVIDQVISEPAGGAHRNPLEAMELVKRQIQKGIQEVKKLSREERAEKRFEKFRNMGNKTIFELK